MSFALHIFYQNLRIKDNPSLSFACKHDKILSLYIHQEKGKWAIGAASKVWLHKSLKSLASDLKEHGVKLHLAVGDFVKVALEYVKDYKISDVYFDQPIEPGILDVKALEVALKQLGVNFHLFHHSILFQPQDIFTKNGDPYQVFTPFYKCCLLQEPPPKPLGIPKQFPKNIEARSLTVEELDLMPKIHWETGFFAYFTPGEKGAFEAFNSFKKEAVYSYKENRDYPFLDGTSRLSPHLHFGEISAHSIYHALNDAEAECYKRQLIWREFAHHLLFHFPKTPLEPLKEAYKDFPWHKNAAFFKKWTKGLTGIPIVDAGMRQLWKTGWMHNRVRMIVGSFLVKDLMIPWQEGAIYFWDTLVDADLANNTLGWQWVAGCGADAAPYFRVFNPYIQSSKFDPKGEYIKEFIPELKDLDIKYIHAPHEAPEDVLRKAGVILGKDYPYPIVDHKEAKEKALKIYYNWNQ